MTATEWEQEERAFFLLQWVPYSLPVEFDEDLAAQRYYTKLWRQRSDAALDELQKAEERQAQKAQRSTTDKQILPCHSAKTTGTTSKQQRTQTPGINSDSLAKCPPPHGKAMKRPLTA